MPKVRNFLFVLSPNAGILDAWLPVLDRLAGTPNVRIHALLPRPTATLNLRPSDFLLEHARKIFASAHVRMPNGRWDRTDSLDHARLKVRNFLRLARILDRLLPKRSGRSDSETTIDKKTAREHLARWGLEAAEGILCDVFECRKPYFSDVIDATPQALIYSTGHGIDLWQDAQKPGRSSEKPIKHDWVKRVVNVFVSGQLEVAFYKKSLGLSTQQLTVTGVFRHDPEWLGRIRSLSNGFMPEKGSYFFLISRPVNRAILPLAEKHRILSMVHREALERGLKLLIRRHPLESKGTTKWFRRVLGKPGERNQWWETDSHPLDVGADCALAVSLYSSVAIDMAAIDVPVIEPIDFENCPDNASNIRFDGYGKPTSFYRKYGFAEGATSTADFNNAIDRALVAQPKANTNGFRAYQGLYANPAGSIEIAVRSILECQPE